jgi:hypothetical protein
VLDDDGNGEIDDMEMILFIDNTETNRMVIDREHREAKAKAEMEKRNKPKATIVETIEKGFWGHLKEGDLKGFVQK